MPGDPSRRYVAFVHRCLLVSLLLLVVMRPLVLSLAFARTSILALTQSNFGYLVFQRRPDFRGELSAPSSSSSTKTNTTRTATTWIASCHGIDRCSPSR